MPPKWLGSRGTLLLLKVLGILGAIGCGEYATYSVMWHPDGFRWAILFFYIVLFSLFIITAELELLQHKVFKQFSKFLTTFTGRAIFYIFIGGLLLKDYGWIPGIWMISVGFLNVIAQCACSEALNVSLWTGKQKEKPQGAAPTPQPQQI
jgi:hypothetical protein